MKLVIEIALPEEALKKTHTYANMVHNLLRAVEPKVQGLLSRSTACVCDAPEADDQIRDLFGRVIGTLSLRCDCGAPVRTGYTLCTNCYTKMEEDMNLSKAQVALRNHGYSTHRFKDNPEEQLFAEAWDAHNNSNTPGYLAYLLTTGDQRFPAEPSERDRQVAATIIQWLGSPVGRGFLQDLGYTKKE
jgi:hypothetical protein